MPATRHCTHQTMAMRAYVCVRMAWSSKSEPPGRPAARIGVAEPLEGADAFQLDKRLFGRLLASWLDRSCSPSVSACMLLLVRVHCCLLAPLQACSSAAASEQTQPDPMKPFFASLHGDHSCMVCEEKPRCRTHANMQCMRRMEELGRACSCLALAVG